jgi:hypothetical protein
VIASANAKAVRIAFSIAFLLLGVSASPEKGSSIHPDFNHLSQRKARRMTPRVAKMHQNSIILSITYSKASTAAADGRLTNMVNFLQAFIPDKGPPVPMGAPAGHAAKRQLGARGPP